MQTTLREVEPKALIAISLAKFMLQITDLTIRVAGRTLLDKGSLRVDGGHRVGLVGRNGTGKST